MKGCEERDYFYNIADLSILYFPDSSDSASIKVINSDDLQFNIKPSDIYNASVKDNKLDISLSDIQKIPRAISAYINKFGQKRDLHVEIVPPFSGVNVFDPNGNKLDDSSVILISNFKGYRIIAPYRPNSIYLKLYNIKKPQITHIRQLHNIVTPLREYEDYVVRLFKLTDEMDSDSAVVIELLSYDNIVLSKYFVRSYNKSLSYEIMDHSIEFNLDETEKDIDLFAIPLECSADNIELISLNKLAQNTFAVPLDTLILNKYILFSDLGNNENLRIAPRFISTNPENIPTDDSDRNKRIKLYCHFLETELADQNSWLILLKYYQLCVQQGIQYSTFDILRAAASKPALVAKLFCLLSIHNTEQNFLDKTCKELEDNLGFCFHWLSSNHWSNAIDWVKESLAKVAGSTEIEIIVNTIQNKIYELINNNEPVIYFAKIADYIVKSEGDSINFMFNIEQRDLRQNLGARVLRELPKVAPKIPECYKKLLPVNHDNAIIKILLKVPVAVALSISGLDETLWIDNEDLDTIHRNIQYCQWIAPDWYGKSILYCLYRLKNM